MQVQGFGFDKDTFAQARHFESLPKFRKQKFDPDIDLIRKGDGYRYATKSEQKRKRDRIKKEKQEISMNRRKGILENIGKIIGKSLVSKHNALNQPKQKEKPKGDKILMKLESLLDRQAKKLKLPGNFKRRDSKM